MLTVILSSVFRKTPRRNCTDLEARLPGFTFNLPFTCIVILGQYLNYLTVPQSLHLKSEVLTVPTSKDCCVIQINI